MNDKDKHLQSLTELGYERIANKISLLWGTAELQQYFSELVVQDRDDREGFPINIFSIILSLYTLHEQIPPMEIKRSEKWAVGYGPLV